MRKTDQLRRSQSKDEPRHAVRRALDLTEALRILKHAGFEDLTQLSDGREAQIQAVIDGLCDLSVHDGLTGLVNATFFHYVLSREINRSLRTGRTCGLMVLDADHFKEINDSYGHRVGDLALRALAETLQQSLRSMDTAARIGGEEFGVILPECSPQDALSAGARIHSSLNPLVVNIDTVQLHLTTSAGLAWTDPHEATNSIALVSRADREMYRAKKSGRSRLCHPPIISIAVSPEERAALNQPEEDANDE